MPETYKEKHGTTRVGDWLRKLADTGRKIAPELLSVAGDLTGVDALKELGRCIDEDPELNDREKSIARMKIEQDIEEAREITKRWQSDNEQESWLPRHVRPLTLVATVLFTFSCIVLDSANFIDVKDAWANMLEMMSLTVIGGYFAVRTVDKRNKHKTI